MHRRILRHNRTRHIKLDTHLCRACWQCIAACPDNVIGKVDLLFHKHAHIDHPQSCKGCFKCVRVCPNKAIISCRTRVKENNLCLT